MDGRWRIGGQHCRPEASLRDTTSRLRKKAPRRDGLQPVGFQPQPVRCDPASAFQVLGQGPLDAAQRARLTEAERRRCRISPRARRGWIVKYL